MLKSPFSPYKSHYQKNLMSNICRAILITVAGAGFALLQTPVKAWEVYRGPVSSAIAPGLPGAPSQHGENGFRVEADRPCVIRKPDGTTQVVVLRHIVGATQASKIDQQGVSGGISLFSWGVSGSVHNLKITPNPPVENFDRYLQLTEAGQTVACAAASDPNLNDAELKHAKDTLQVLRRGTVDGMSATYALQQAYNALRDSNPNHPKLTAAMAAANKGDYEAAISLLSH